MQKNFVQTLSFQPYGVTGLPVFIECQCILALPQIIIIGIPSQHAIAMRERIVNALSALNMALPNKKVTISIRCEVQISCFESLDLAVTIAILVSLGRINRDSVNSACFLANIGLNGDLHPTTNQHSIIAFLAAHEIERVYLAAGFLTPITEEIKGGGFRSLAHVMQNLSGTGAAPERNILAFEPPEIGTGVQFCRVRGQKVAKRAAVIAAAGAHHILLWGARGSGKTMLCESMSDLLPVPTRTEWLQILGLYRSQRERLPSGRPFRRPHYSATKLSLIGGGLTLRPGECGLAHLGILFLDEILEFSRETLEHLRTPMELGEVHLSRGQSSVVIPSRFQLVAAANLSPCGLLGHPERKPKSSFAEIVRYQKRLSQAMLDRFDLQLTVRPESERILLGPEESSQSFQSLKSEIEKARGRMIERQGCPNGYLVENAWSKAFGWDSKAQRNLAKAVERRSLSNRAMIGVARVARTIADLDGRNAVENNDILEALFYRGDASGVNGIVGT